MITKNTGVGPVDNLTAAQTEESMKPEYYKNYHYMQSMKHVWKGFGLSIELFAKRMKSMNKLDLNFSNNKVVDIDIRRKPELQNVTNISRYDKIYTESDFKNKE